MTEQEVWNSLQGRWKLVDKDAIITIADQSIFFTGQQGSLNTIVIRWFEPARKWSVLIPSMLWMQHLITKLTETELEITDMNNGNPDENIIIDPDTFNILNAGTIFKFVRLQ